MILPIVEMLWLRSAPALRVMCGQYGTRNLPDFHAAALAALRAGNAEGVAGAMRSDILQGLEAVRAGLV